YPSEQQDWEPPDWPPHLPATGTLPAAGEGLDVGPPADEVPGQGLPADPDWDPELDLPADPGWNCDLELAPDPDRDPNLELPPDPFPDWDHFPSGHEFPAADTDDPCWPAPPRTLSRTRS
ncbi:hypothetical protein QK291_04355, partial [Arthrobacter sp. AL12]|nr:hypothetical protein [Arthrobacter sp. AL12]